MSGCTFLGLPILVSRYSRKAMHSSCSERVGLLLFPQASSSDDPAQIKSLPDVPCRPVNAQPSSIASDLVPSESWGGQEGRPTALTAFLIAPLLTRPLSHIVYLLHPRAASQSFVHSFSSQDKGHTHRDN